MSHESASHESSLFVMSRRRRERKGCAFAGDDSKQLVPDALLSFKRGIRDKREEWSALGGLNRLSNKARSVLIQPLTTTKLQVLNALQEAVLDVLNCNR